MSALALAERPAAPGRRASFDPDVVAAAASGDAEAFAVLHAQLVKPISATVERLVGGVLPNDVADVVQDIFRRLARELHRWTPARGASLNTWIYTLVRNHCFDVLKRKRLPMVALEGYVAEAAAALEAREPSVPELLAFEELRQSAADAIARLPQEQRTIVRLRVEEQKEPLEIAAVLGLALGTVKSRLARARDALRHELRAFLAAS
ncbi:MAG: sigma-70 family RNA polymerase sigma factor [Planctomycetes bacterium]|nr:sigma-70 family RNA polymerase sigma factor [Planctomycetota bacterium]